jgi:hypothetical protein
MIDCAAATGRSISIASLACINVLETPRISVFVIPHMIETLVAGKKPCKRFAT